MRKHVPNLLTLLRLVLTGVFLVALNQYRFQTDGVVCGCGWMLLLCAALFIIAAVTDALDGYLARKWNVESAFGRIMDPFCDKVLVLAAFVYLAGPRFATVDGTLVSGVYPWMVVVILARELLVTSVRGAMEGQGQKFGAMKLGKWKMILQSIIIPVVLVIVWLNPTQPDRQWLGVVRDIAVYLTVVVTLLSGLPYLVRATHMLKETKHGE